ncbi:hypothetical protein IPH70_00550 [Candidatus Roizmanbacteria bacterium]|nr:MAG: hypothetical protein IPH70_00550 [Candidatus Roizmanbacteria bacterium]
MTCGSDAGGSDSGWIDGGSNVYLITSSDNVGIGTTAPGAKLDVVGSGLFSQNLTVTGSVSAGSLTVGGDTSQTLQVQDLVQLVTHLSPPLVPQSQTGA